MIKLLLSCASFAAIAFQVHSMISPSSTVAVSQPPAFPVPSTATPVVKTPDELYAEINPKVVKLEVQAGRKQEIGSGAILKGNLVTTCFHVVRSGGEITVRMADKQTTYSATVLAKDERLDLAVLKISDAPELPAIALGTGVVEGDRVFAFGSPLGEQGSMTEGKVLEAKNKHGDILMDALLKPGNSGGPLINKKAELTGTNCGVIDGNPPKGITKPVDQTKELLGGVS